MIHVVYNDDTSSLEYLIMLFDKINKSAGKDEYWIRVEYYKFGKLIFSKSNYVPSRVVSYFLITIYYFTALIENTRAKPNNCVYLNELLFDFLWYFSRTYKISFIVNFAFFW